MTRGPVTRTSSGNFPARSVCLGLLVVGLGLSQEAFDFMVYDRDALLHGDLWRWLTGHLVHSSANHLGWDLLGMLLVGSYLERHLRAGWTAALIGGFVGVDVSLWLYEDSLMRYCGLSGLNVSMMAMAVVHYGRSQQHGLRWLPAVIITLKLLSESVWGSTLVSDGWNVFTPAHWGGALGGLGAYVVLIGWRLRDQQAQPRSVLVRRES